jgi:hypothetical protein
LIKIDFFTREILVVNIKPLFSREREIQITRKEDVLIPLYRDLYASTRNVKGRNMYPMKVERIINFSIVGIMEMWRRSIIIIENIYRRMLRKLKETCSLFANPLIISPSKLELLKTCCLIFHE